ncbi:hypothetical protein CCP2SC5_1240007 [Azospirillaceae bacterium]
MFIPSDRDPTKKPPFSLEIQEAQLQNQKRCQEKSDIMHP